nr:LCP family protein [Symbiobacterium terraclitae]
MALDQDALRTDVLLLVSFDLEQKRVAAIQIPRDTRAYLAGKGTIEKVNHAYVYGIVDEYGNIDPDEVFPSNLRTLKTVEGLLGVRIHHTVVVDMAAFVRAIDAIGGVEVDIPFKMEYDDPYQDLHIHFEPGPQVLNGQKALEYVRWRHNNDGTGYPDEDLGRIRAQQAFMRTVIAKVTSPGSLVRLPALLQELAGYVESTIEPSRLPALIALVAGLDPGSVEITTLPGTSASLYEVGLDQYLNYYLHDPVATRQLVDRLVHGIDPELAAEVRVEVAAAAGDPRAEAIIGRMAEQGFQVGRTDPPAELPAAVRVEPSGDAAGSLMVARSLLGACPGNRT